MIGKKRKKIKEFAPTRGKVMEEFQPCEDGKKSEVLNTRRIIDDVKVTSRYNVTCHLGSGAFSEVRGHRAVGGGRPYRFRLTYSLKNQSCAVVRRVRSQVGPHTNFKQIRFSSLPVLRTPCIQLGCKTWLLGSALKVILLAGR